ncbi:MAG: hypothetical protein J3K34DRAFT_410484 [Monoraphidium minutum]|nr:MAG: hypothetical protein J3K34DRAFT_410484 [Monoraphidium minutum]
MPWCGTACFLATGSAGRLCGGVFAWAVGRPPAAVAGGGTVVFRDGQCTRESGRHGRLRAERRGGQRLRRERRVQAAAGAAFAVPEAPAAKGARVRGRQLAARHVGGRRRQQRAPRRVEGGVPQRARGWAEYVRCTAGLFPTV